MFLLSFQIPTKGKYATSAYIHQFMVLFILYMVIFGSFICIAVNCGPLSHPPKGRVTTSGYSVGSTATYSCEVGYTLEGGKKRECLATGEWSGKEPVCTGKYTYPRVIQFQSSTVDSPMGIGKFNATRSSSVLSSLLPLLHAVIDCGILDPPTNGAVQITGTAFGDKAVYSCNSGYFLRGQNNRECQSGGEWSGEEPVCERKQFLF